MLLSYFSTRELNKEREGCSKAGRAIRQAIHPIKHMADYNISGPFNAIAKNIQKLDGDNAKGTRAISFSKHREILEGFSFNIQNHLFDGVVRSPLNYTLNRQQGSATVVFPELIPQINFLNRDNKPLFRFVVALSIISDIWRTGPFIVRFMDNVLVPQQTGNRRSCVFQNSPLSSL